MKMLSHHFHSIGNLISCAQKQLFSVHYILFVGQPQHHASQQAGKKIVCILTSTLVSHQLIVSLKCLQSPALVRPNPELPLLQLFPCCPFHSPLPALKTCSEFRNWPCRPVIKCEHQQNVKQGTGGEWGPCNVGHKIKQADRKKQLTQIGWGFIKQQKRKNCWQANLSWRRVGFLNAPRVSSPLFYVLYDFTQLRRQQLIVHSISGILYKIVAKSPLIIQSLHIKKV